MTIVRNSRSAHAIVLAGTFAVAFLCAACHKEPEGSLVWQLTHLKEYQPPESASTDSAGYFPTVYVRAEGDSLYGIVNPNPLEPFRDIAESSPPDLVMQLRFTRQVLQERVGDSLRVPGDANLVLDRKMTFGQVMGAIYVANYGSFVVPHLITAAGREQVIEPPRIHEKFGPVGWAAWVWWMPDQALVWTAWSDVAERFTVRAIPSKGGLANIAALLDSLRLTLDARDYIPVGPDRLIGIWAYDELAYSELMQFMDALRYPREGSKIAGRITLLQGENWRPPSQSERGSPSDQPATDAPGSPPPDA